MGVVLIFGRRGEVAMRLIPIDYEQDQEGGEAQWHDLMGFGHDI